ncbi:MAG: flavin-containing monooxygenase [Acidimicrobiia bacterium]
MTSVELAIIGTGFGGLAAGRMARRRGIHSFVLLERSESVGGTWRDNTYPGCACDIPSALYSFSFAPNPEWSRRYPSQPEIRDYLEKVTDDFGLRDDIVFGFEVAELRWDDRAQRWSVSATDGRVVEARSVISATGPLSQPSDPDIEGLDSFAGPVFHSARWDHSGTVAGARVAVIGTGASAIQLVPAIVDEGASLTVFQRTPPWVLPREDPPTPPWRRRLFRTVPLLQRLQRWRVYVRQELLVVAFIGRGSLAQKFRERVRTEARALIVASFTEDADAAESLVPTYEPGCKRILISSDWYATLRRDDVTLVTEPIDRVETDGIVTVDGRRHEVDVVVLATGFAASSFPAPMTVIGRDGIDLRDHWSDGAVSDLGMAVTGFPNLWFLIGPGTGLGHNSMVFMIESQLRFIDGALEHSRRTGGRALEVRAEVEHADRTERRRRLRGTVWASGCDSWYQDAQGRIDAIWPGTTIEYWWRTRRFHPERYRSLDPSSATPFGTGGIRPSGGR